MKNCVFLSIVVTSTLLSAAVAKRGKRAMFTGTDGENIIDLSWNISPNSFVYPGHGGPFTTSLVDFSHVPFWLLAKRFDTAEHVATHIDAPIHFDENGLMVHELDLKHLIGRGVMIDMTKDGKPLEGNYAITKQDFLDWEAKHGKVKESILFFRTGLGEFYETDTERYMGTKNLSDTTSYKFPGIGTDLAQFLVDERNIDVLGTDTLSTDVGSSLDFASHRILQKAGIVLIENLANLHLLADRPKEFHVIVFPMKIKDATGAPTRVVAIMDDK